MKMSIMNILKPTTLCQLVAAGACCVLMSGCMLLHGPSFDPRAEGPAKTADGGDFKDVADNDKIRPEWLQPPAGEYKLGPGDKLVIELLGEADTRADTIVTPDGKIYYSVIPGIDVLGKTMTEVQKELEAKLVTLYRRPQVSVQLHEANSQRIWVLGRLYSPGIFPLNRPMRVLDAISLAGGLYASRQNGTTQELADLSHSFLKRQGKLMPVNFQKLIRDGDLSHNIYLEPNDYLYLPSSLNSEIYVFGAVVEPHPVGFMNEMNIMAALGQVNGPAPNADLEHVTIIRGSLTEPKYAVVNVRAVATGKAKNFRLEPGDIVYVPSPGQFFLSHYVKAATETFVQVVVAGEAANAVGTGANLNISVGADGKVTPSVSTSDKTTFQTGQATPVAPVSTSPTAAVTPTVPAE